jgi:hypothetical protein
MKAIIEAPEFVHKMFANWDIGEEGKQKVWQAFVEHMVGVNYPISLQADLDNFTDEIEESGEIDEILDCE